MTGKPIAIAVASRKGGSSKTTLVVHLGVLAASKGHKVLIVDTDPQESASKWFDRRAGTIPPLVNATAGKLPDVLEAAAEDGIEFVMVDTPPHAGAQIDQVVRLADLVLVPLKPTPMDLDAIPATVEIVRAHRVPAAFVITSAPPRSSITGEAIAELKNRFPDIPVCPVMIGHRAAYYYALIDGRAVTEFEPSGKAAREITALWEWTLRQSKKGAASGQESIAADNDAPKARRARAGGTGGRRAE
jgi:chromosome partitioning protein